jgi:uncharacterized protein with HEPN domain
MSARSNLLYLGHIRDAMARIQTYIKGVDQVAFLADVRTQDAVIRQLEIIGEAARRVEKHFPDITARDAIIPWRLMGDMRNRLIHDYADVDLDLVWIRSHCNFLICCPGSRL